MKIQDKTITNLKRITHFLPNNGCVWYTHWCGNNGKKENFYYLNYIRIPKEEYGQTLIKFNLTNTKK